MLPVDAALERPTAARWLKLLSLSPPMSVTKPTLIVACGVPPPVLPPPQAARTRARSRVALRASKRPGGFLIDPPKDFSSNPSIPRDCSTKIFEIFQRFQGL